MESPDYRILIRRSAELRARSAQARETSGKIIAESRELEARTALLHEDITRLRRAKNRLIALLTVRGRPGACWRCGTRTQRLGKPPRGDPAAPGRDSNPDGRLAGTGPGNPNGLRRPARVGPAPCDRLAGGRRAGGGRQCPRLPGFSRGPSARCLAARAGRSSRIRRQGPARAARGSPPGGGGGRHPACRTLAITIAARTSRR